KGFVRRGAERGKSRDRDRLTGWELAVFRQRVHEQAVLAEPIVEMRSGRGTGCADAANEFSLIDVRARPNALGKRGEVQVVALETARVANAHHVAAPAAPPGRHDSPRRHCDHWRADRGAVVDAKVSAVGAIDGMEAAS